MLQNSFWKKTLICITAILLTTSAFAQQQNIAAIDRISSSLGQCIAGFEKKIDEITVLQDRLNKAEAKIKELEEKDKK